MRIRLLLATFCATAVVTALQPGCTGFYDCLYVPSMGYRVCGQLEPVISTTMAGDVIEIEDDLGAPPSGCTCMHEFTQPAWDVDQLAPEMDPLYEQMEIDARIDCEELALQLGADPLPCETAKIDKPTAERGEERSDKCLFSEGDIDDDPDCPPYGEDGVNFTTDDGADEAGEPTDTSTTDDGPVIPDLPKQP